MSKWWRVDDFQDPDKKPRKALIIPMRKMAEIPAPTIAINEFNTQIDTSCQGGEHMPGTFKSVDHLRKTVQDWRFPAPLKDKSSRLSSRLVADLFTSGRSSITRNLYDGSLDPRKLVYIKRQVQRGFDPSQDAIYRRITFTNRKRPHIAIVACTSWCHMWSSPTYIPTVGEIVVAVVGAAQALQCNMTAAMGMELHESKNTLVMSMVEDTSGFSPLDLAPCFHRESYRMGFISLGLFDKELYKDFHHFGGRYKDPSWESWIYGSRTTGRGGHLVSWAKSRGAEIIIALGDVIDKEKANIHLSDTEVRDGYGKGLADKIVTLIRKQRGLLNAA